MFAVSIKGVLFTAERKVVLVLNGRGEWELPGGRIEVGETFADCLAREFAEELGLTVDVDSLLDTYLFEVLPDKYVFIVTYGCRVKEGFPNY